MLKKFLSKLRQSIAPSRSEKAAPATPASPAKSHAGARPHASQRSDRLSGPRAHQGGADKSSHGQTSHGSTHGQGSDERPRRDDRGPRREHGGRSHGSG